MASLDRELSHVYSREYAVSLDAQDPLRTRSQFLIPSKGQLRAKSLAEAGKKCGSGDGVEYRS